MPPVSENSKLRAVLNRNSAAVATSHDPHKASSLGLQNFTAEDYGQAGLTDKINKDWTRHFRAWSPITAEQVRLCCLVGSAHLYIFSEQREFTLRPAAVKLSLAWSQFRDKVPSKDAASWQHRAPSFNDVVDIMESISSQFEIKRDQGAAGLVCRYFRRSCHQLKSHETLLSILPEGNEYCSLFTGVLKSIIHASTTARDSPRTLSDSC